MKLIKGKLIEKPKNWTILYTRGQAVGILIHKGRGKFVTVRFSR